MKKNYGKKQFALHDLAKRQFWICCSWRGCGGQTYKNA
jgi:hypothetical protein